jgi:hypothetical protein
MTLSGVQALDEEEFNKATATAEGQKSAAQQQLCCICCCHVSLTVVCQPQVMHPSRDRI